MATRKKQTKLEHELIAYAREYKWKVYHIETFGKSPVVRRFAMVKTGCPTVKVMIADEKVIIASQWMYGRMINPNRRAATTKTIKQWLRGRQW